VKAPVDLAALQRALFFPAELCETAFEGLAIVAVVGMAGMRRTSSHRPDFGHGERNRSPTRLRAMLKARGKISLVRKDPRCRPRPHVALGLYGTRLKADELLAIRT
jgi:hypothetical protein